MSWMPLPALRTFVEVARWGSFKKAAHMLNVTPTAVSHQIRKLEEQLGCDLFERHVRRILLTREGARLYPILEDAFGRIGDALDAVRRDFSQSSLVVSATMAVSTFWIAPQVRAFRTAFPELGCRILASDDVVDLGSGDADLAVRFQRDINPGLESLDLAPGRFAPVAAPSLARLSVRDAPLLAFEWMSPHPEAPDWEKWWREAGFGALDTGRIAWFSDEAHAVQAAISGQGVLLANVSLLGRELATGLLKWLDGPILPYGQFRLVRSRKRRSAIEDAAWQWWCSALSRAASPIDKENPAAVNLGRVSPEET